MSTTVLSHVFAAFARPTKLAFRSSVRLVSRTTVQFKLKTQQVHHTNFARMFKPIERGSPNSLDYRVYIGNYILYNLNFHIWIIFVLKFMY